MRSKHIAFTVISAAVTGLLYTFYDVGILSFITLVPYFYVIFDRALNHRKAKMYRLGLLFSFPYYVSVLYWFCYQYPLDFMGFSNAMSIAYIALAWLGLSLLYTLTMALVPVVVSCFLNTEFGKTHAYFAPLMTAAIWTTVEWMHTKTFLGVPWARLALTQQNYTVNLQIASLFGSYGVTFIIVFVNAAVAYGTYVFTVNKEKRKAYICFASAAIVLLSNTLFGVLSIRLDERKDKSLMLASALQGNMMSSEKWGYSGADIALERYSGLVAQAASEGSELMVFPETAFATDIRYGWLRDELSDLSAQYRVTLVVGAFDEALNENDEYESYNAMYMFYPDGRMEEQTYIKRKLVPFGEYLPAERLFCTLFPFLNEINLFDDVLTPGEESRLFETEYGKIGALICFDSIYELLSVESVSDGAGLLVLGTNDSWFEDSSAIYEHNGQAVLRAIENRRYIVRAANTGMSSVISPRGEVLASIEPLEEGQITEYVSFRDDVTFYNRYPNLLIFFTHIFIISMLFIPRSLKRSAKYFLKK